VSNGKDLATDRSTDISSRWQSRSLSDVVAYVDTFSLVLTQRRIVHCNWYCHCYLNQCDDFWVRQWQWL